MDNYRPLSPIAVEEAIQHTLKELRKSTEHTEEIAQAAARAEHAYRTGYAKARLTHRATVAKSTKDAADDHATATCADELLAHLLAQGTLTARREANRSLQSRLDGLRSISASLRGNI